MRARVKATLATLNRRAALAHELPELETLLAELFRDARCGARTLARTLRQRKRRLAKETGHLEQLLARAQALRAAGARAVAGVDEAGMGPLAGPVVAAAVVLPERPHLRGLDDSKRLAPCTRARLAEAIRRQALGFCLAEVWPEEIDRMNIYRAGLEAMRRVVAGLFALAPRLAVDHVLVDARTIPGLAVPQTRLIHGDALDASIAAASILAKTHRDALMEAQEALHPGYGFAAHKGYATAQHLAALRRLGPCPIHRRSFAPVAAVAR
ncbi:MAG TPA: ribonuclease HII [Myxococcota bacterium]|nr:ribonuclease HII [Myxococcota bacterium]